VKSELAKFLEEAEDWKRLETSVDGVTVVKMPAKGGYPERLSVEINPTLKRRGIFIRDNDELEQLSKVFGSEEVSKLVKTVTQVNPEAKKTGILKL